MPSSAVLGIAGPSCSGKSTVAALVAKASGARLFHLDAYWIEGCAKPIVNGAPSYERPEQYDGAAMAADIARHLAEAPGVPVVAEGFVAFLYPELAAMCGAKAFIAVPDPVLEARRAARARSRGDASGGGKKAAIERAWLANGLDEWRRLGAGQAAMPGVVAVDGTRPPDKVASSVLEIWSPGMGMGFARHASRGMLAGTSPR